MPEYVEIKNLPEPIRRALDAVNCKRGDIGVLTVTTLRLGEMGAGDGRQNFTALVNLSTGEHHVTYGSWGGINMFDRENPVDNDDREYTLPQDGVVIKGTRGGTHPVWAQLFIPAAMTARILPAPREELPQAELDALAIFVGYTSAARPEYLRRHRVTSATVDTLITKGLLKRNRAGATSVTTAGRNAVGSHRVY